MLNDFHIIQMLPKINIILKWKCAWLLLTLDFVRVDAGHRIEEFAVETNRHNATKYTTQENVNKVVAVVLDTRQGHIRCQQERRYCEKV